MYVLRLIAAAVAVFIIQMTLVHHITLAGASPDMMLVLLVILVLDRKPVTAIIIGFLLGFLQDLGNASFLGMNAMAKSVVAYGIARLGSDYLPDNVLFRGLLVFCALLANDIIVLNISASFDPAEVITTFFRYSLLSALYTAVIGVVVLKILHLIPRRMVRTSGGY